jgi:hypothetical protein
MRIGTRAARAWATGGLALVALAAMRAADAATAALRLPTDEAQSTTATMPYPQDWPAARVRLFKRFYAYSQVHRSRQYTPTLTARAHCCCAPPLVIAVHSDTRLRHVRQPILSIRRPVPHPVRRAPDDVRYVTPVTALCHTITTTHV